MRAGSRFGAAMITDRASGSLGISTDVQNAEKAAGDSQRLRTFRRRKFYKQTGLEQQRDVGFRQRSAWRNTGLRQMIRMRKLGEQEQTGVTRCFAAELRQHLAPGFSLGWEPKT